MPEPVRYRLGRLAPQPVDVGDLTHYLTAPLPDAPPTVDAPDLRYPMAANDRLGDCTIAGALHVDQVTASLTGQPWTYAGDEAVEKQYLALTGGADTGLVETRVLAVWQQQGLFGKQLACWAPVHPKHTNVIRQTVFLTGSVYCGVLINANAQAQFQNRRPWDLTGNRGDDEIEGGHAVPAVGYNATGPIFVTWGALQQATWRWVNAFLEEAYAPLTAEIKASGKLRNVAFAALEADLSALSNA